MKHSLGSFIVSLSFLVVLSVGCSGFDIPGLAPTLTPVPRYIYVVATATNTPTATMTPANTPTPAPTLTPEATPTPFITAPPAGESVEIPILMYHHLKYRAPTDGEVLRTWSVAPDQFAAQLDYLEENGFNTITFKQLVEFFEQRAPLPEHPVLLTFDDGWLDAYTVAFPELEKRGMFGNFFIVTQYADAGGELLINWDQVLEMDRGGMEFGGHTLNHADLSKLTLDEMQNQLAGAKRIMEEKLGHPTYALSYPFGAFNPYVIEQTRVAGYRAALILCCGYEQSADILLALPRIRVSYDDTLQDFAGKLP